MIERILELSVMNNGERKVKLHSVIVHETDTGYAQCFKEDATNPQMGEIRLSDIKFSEAVMDEWEDKNLLEKMINKIKIENPKDV